MRRFLILILMLLPVISFSQTTFMAPMRDGIELATDVYLPADTTNGPVPVVLCRTPYGRTGGGAFQTKLFSHNIGYICQDTRGRGGSQGVDSLFLDDGWREKQDGYDTVEWLASQSWCDGRVGIFGISALGITGYLCAGSTPPHLTTAFIIHASSDLFGDAIYPGGCFRKEQVDSWTLFMGLTHYKSLFQSHYIQDEFWDWLNLETRAEQISIPIFHVAGWHDTFCEGNFKAFSALQEFGGTGAASTQKLLVGPWTHANWGSRKQGDLTFPANSVRNLETTASDWFAYYLRDADNGMADLPPVNCYIMGDCSSSTPAGDYSNQWVNFESWPPENVNQETFYLLENLSVNQTGPVSTTSALNYHHDPAAPLMCNGGRNLGWFPGPKNQILQDTSPQNIAWTSETLSTPVTVTGNVTAKIYLSSDCIDTDVMVRLEDVYPNGASYLVMDGAQKARFRNGQDKEEFMEPNQIYEIDVNLGNIAATFDDGHKIRVAVSSALFPRYDVNPNSGDPVGNQTNKNVANNTIYTNSIYSSKIVLPVLQTGTRVATNENPRLASTFTLHQNYPNPFNNSTRIRFSLKKSSFATLTIFDMLGKKVAQLHNSYSAAGDYEYNFDGKNLASGVYICVLETEGKFIETNKLLLLK